MDDRVLPAIRFCFFTLGWLCLLAAVAGPLAIAATVDDAAAGRVVLTVFVSSIVAAAWHFLVVVVLDLLTRIAESAEKQTDVLVRKLEGVAAIDAEQRELIRDIGADIEWFKERLAKT